MKDIERLRYENEKLRKALIHIKENSRGRARAPKAVLQEVLKDTAHVARHALKEKE